MIVMLKVMMMMEIIIMVIIDDADYDDADGNDDGGGGGDADGDGDDGGGDDDDAHVDDDDDLDGDGNNNNDTNGWTFWWAPAPVGSSCWAPERLPQRRSEGAWTWAGNLRGTGTASSVSRQVYALCNDLPVILFYLEPLIVGFNNISFIALRSFYLGHILVFLFHHWSHMDMGLVLDIFLVELFAFWFTL